MKRVEKINGRLSLVRQVRVQNKPNGIDRHGEGLWTFADQKPVQHFRNVLDKHDPRVRTAIRVHNPRDLWGRKDVDKPRDLGNRGHDLQGSLLSRFALDITYREPPGETQCAKQGRARVSIQVSITVSSEPLHLLLVLEGNVEDLLAEGGQQSRDDWVCTIGPKSQENDQAQEDKRRHAGLCGTGRLGLSPNKNDKAHQRECGARIKNHEHLVDVRPGQGQEQNVDQGRGSREDRQESGLGEQGNEQGE